MSVRGYREESWKFWVKSRVQVGSNKHQFYHFYDEGGTYRYGWGFKLWKFTLLISLFQPRSNIIFKYPFYIGNYHLRHVQYFYRIFTMVTINIFHSQLCPLCSLSAIFPGDNSEWEDGSFGNPICFFIQKSDLCLKANFLFYAYYKGNLENLGTWH